ncbi:MAG TPA: SDR family NAD(P)-dependent oxidoreductase [Gaiellaceae bacterium]|nr:SDR family NAD(P)-dependent oxidoreductase [Gaiellaceae bacterium]
MARVFVTGSADGLGLIAARLLADQGHEVVLHARNERRAADAFAAVPRASAVVIGDLSTIAEMRAVAKDANATGAFDAVIHNAAVGYREQRRLITRDGLCHLFAINVLAPYLLTVLIELPRRLIYLSSGLHRSGNPSLDDLQWAQRPWHAMQAYSDSKLFDAVLAAAVARYQPAVCSNAVEPGWVATKMGGPNAPDDPTLGATTQAWLAVSDDPEALVSGGYFFHQRLRETSPAVHDHQLQDGLLAYCAAATGEALPWAERN